MLVGWNCLFQIKSRTDQAIIKHANGNKTEIHVFNDLILKLD